METNLDTQQTFLGIGRFW